MNTSNRHNLLKIAIKEGCKTVKDLAEFLKVYDSKTGTYTPLSV